MNRNTASMLLGVIRVLLITAIPMQSFAQTVSPLTVGTKVRVLTFLPNKWRVGYIQSVDSSGLSATTRSPGENKATASEATYMWTIPHSSIRRVEVSRGPGGNRAGRTIVGALLGGLGGGLMLGTIGYMSTRCSNCTESGIGVIAGPIIGVPIGVLFGGLAGFASTRERWQSVSVAGEPVPARR